MAAPSTALVSKDSAPTAPKGGNWPIFVRLLSMLRPYYRTIAFGLLLLVIGSPCELFPAMVWRYVTDDVVLQAHTSPWMQWWISFGGHVQSRFGLLASSVVWLFGVYAIGEAFGTLESWMLNRVAQKFILRFRNQVY